MFAQAGIEELKIQGRIRVACNPLIPRLPVIAAFKVSLSMKGGGDWGVWVGGEAVWGRMDMGPQGCEGGGEIGVAGQT